ncbi:hypothetical protein EVAR_38966_1 [Eumeta japonica]|uniref:Uncharacterized protein n=1 Tax=Eumeta variegata TaxID=151549 RepID=A0A4C1WB41_EUMVA|nr:hypothetical protein EVAR_38966_1 [Eumeta japonica]
MARIPLSPQYPTYPKLFPLQQSTPPIIRYSIRIQEADNALSSTIFSHETGTAIDSGLGSDLTSTLDFDCHSTLSSYRIDRELNKE